MTQFRDRASLGMPMMRQRVPSQTLATRAHLEPTVLDRQGQPAVPSREALAR